MRCARAQKSTHSADALGSKDVALSRRKQEFDSPRERQKPSNYRAFHLQLPERKRYDKKNPLQAIVVDASFAAKAFMRDSAWSGIFSNCATRQD